MAFDTVTAEIGLLLTRMQNEPEDRYELYEQLREKLNELRAFGMPVPQDLEDLAAALEAEFTEAPGAQEPPV
jgi:phage-related holin